MKLNVVKLKTIAAWMLSLMLLTIVASCDNDDDNNAEPVPVAYVSLYQASPNAPDLSILVDDRQINVYPFQYADYTGYLRFYTGDRNLKFSPYGANNVVLDTAVTFEDAHAYSIFLVDQYPDIRAMILDDNADEPASGNAVVRFVNLSPDAPSLDLVQQGSTEALLGDQSFMDATDFTEVSADTYDFEVRESGTDNVLLNLPDISLQSGWFYTIVVRGYETPVGESPKVLSAQVIVN